MDRVSGFASVFVLVLVWESGSLSFREVNFRSTNHNRNKVTFILSQTDGQVAVSTLFFSPL